MDNWIADLIFVGFALKEVEKSIFADIALTIIIDYKPSIEKAIIPKLVVEEFLDIMVIFENLFIRNENHICAILIACLFFFILFFQKPGSKFCSLLFAFSISSNFKIAA